MTALIRKPIQRHPWRLHKWQDVDGMVGLFGLIRQCQKCHLVEVYQPLIAQAVRGPHTMLKDADR